MAMGSTQPGPGPADRVRDLADRAGSHVQRGELNAARALYQQMLDIVPTHPEALNFIALAALQSGDTRRAVTLLERGAEANPTDANLHKNLGLAYRAAGSAAAALNAFRCATALKPDFAVALLNQGALLIELGRRDEAYGVYLDALDAAERTGLFLKDLAVIPTGVRVLAEKAVAVLQQARAEVFQAALAPVEAGYGRPALVRVRQCLDAYLGRHSESPLPLLQRPTFMTFPGLDNRPWYERADFPWLASIEERTPAIRAELLKVLESDVGFRPFVEMSTDHPRAAYWRQVNRSSSWNAYFFYRDGKRYEENCARCPETAAALDALPLDRVADHSPEALYSVLKPGAQIPPHTGVINCRLVVHLPLIVPPDCGIRVGQETRGWQEGRCIVFDDTFEHEAWNKSPHTRVVVIFDIWNPQLTEAEREGMRTAIEALGSFNRMHGGEAGLHQS